MKPAVKGPQEGILHTQRTVAPNRHENKHVNDKALRSPASQCILIPDSNTRTK